MSQRPGEKTRRGMRTPAALRAAIAASLAPCDLAPLPRFRSPLNAECRATFFALNARCCPALCSLFVSLSPLLVPAVAGVSRAPLDCPSYYASGSLTHSTLVPPVFSLLVALRRRHEGRQAERPRVHGDALLRQLVPAHARPADASARPSEPRPPALRDHRQSGLRRTRAPSSAHPRRLSDSLVRPLSVLLGSKEPS